MVVLFLLSILSFFGCYCVTPVPEESDRGHTITAKKPTTSTNSHQRTQEYIKGKSPSFIFLKKGKNEMMLAFADLSTVFFFIQSLNGRF